LQLACQKSKIVKDFLREEKKLTQRDSRKVQNLFVEINRHPNIKTIKRKPELVVKWIENQEKQEVINA
jgi:3-methyladenine DNA glycosylase AlkD